MAIDVLIEAKLKYRPLLEIGKSYLFKEKDKGNYFEGAVIKLGARDLDEGYGHQAFALVKLLVGKEYRWIHREVIEIQEQYPANEDVQ